MEFGVQGVCQVVPLGQTTPVPGRKRKYDWTETQIETESALDLHTLGATEMFNKWSIQSVPYYIKTAVSLYIYFNQSLDAMSRFF